MDLNLLECVSAMAEALLRGERAILLTRTKLDSAKAVEHTLRRLDKLDPTSLIRISANPEYTMALQGGRGYLLYTPYVNVLRGRSADVLYLPDNVSRGVAESAYPVVACSPVKDIRYYVG